MRCSKCQFDNPDNMQFCGRCGSKLANICPECEFVNPPGFQFCGKCGARLGETAPTPPPRLEDMQDKLYIPEPLRRQMDAAEQKMAGENRLVTALFADISGFTPLSSQHSPERVVSVVNDCFKVIVDTVFRYEGNPNRFIGDNVLAFFGAPIAHENDPERAIMAALEVREGVRKLSLEVSIGINTGMMYFGPIGTKEHLEVSAYGPDINLAKRLQETAEPGQILVGRGTYRLTRRAFDFIETPNLTLKGMDEPVTAYEAIKVKEHPEKLRGIEGLRARMIGREHEFGEVIRSAEEWLDGRGQMVSIIGEAGIGKSRLVSELRGYLATRFSTQASERQHPDSSSPPRSPTPTLPLPPAPLLLEGRCVSIGQPISYWPFLDILHIRFGLSEDDTEAERVQKVREHIEELLPDRCDDILPFLGYLMNLRFGGELDTRLEGYSTEQVSHHTMMRLRDIFVALAQKHRLLLILEDLHWADDLSLDLVSLLMDELMAHPLMLLCVYRPEQKHRVWRLGSQAQRKCLERYTEIQLQKLPPASSRRLVQELLDIDDLPDSVREMILTKSEGNPFFIEEVIRSLIERELVYREDDRWRAKEDIAQIDVPDTIQSVVLARVDRLAAEAKYVLQCASVIGRLFKHRLLEHLTQKQQELDQYITEFEERDLVYEERTIPELEYAFKHALTQEATYQGILEQRRKSFHREVAQGIERLYQERIEDFYEELAHHWERSGDDEKTLEYLMKAGEKAGKSYLNEAAIDYYTRALELAKEIGISGDGLAEIYDARGRVYSNLCFYEECLSDMMKAVNLYTQRAKCVRAYGIITGTYAWYIGDLEEAAQYGRKLLAEIDPEDKSHDSILVYGDTTYALHALWDSGIISLEEGEILLRRAIALSEEMGYSDRLAGLYAILYHMYVDIGLDENDEKRRSSWEKACQYMPYIKPVLSDYSLFCFMLSMGDIDNERMRLCRESFEAGVKSGNAYSTILSAWRLASIYRDQGEIQKAIEVYEHGCHIGIRTRFVSYSAVMTNMINNLMELYVSIGNSSAILDMMLRIVDSTLVLHRKPKVYPTVIHRWNGIVEETYHTLHGVAPDIYRELEHSLESRLGEANADGERFFYYSQLAMLAILDGRQEDAGTYVQELMKLRSKAGSFGSRVSDIIGLVVGTPDDRDAVVGRLLEELQSAIANPQSPIANPLLIAQVLRDIEMKCEFTEHQDIFRQFCRQFRSECSERLEEVSFNQLYLEIHQPSSDYASLEAEDTFDSDLPSPVWEWVDPNADCTRELVSPSGVQITVPPEHDLWVAPHLLQAISGDFAIETRISDGGGGKKSGGLVVWRDRENFIRLEMPSSSVWEGEARFEFAQSGKWFIAGRGRLSAERLNLRLERRGNRFTGYLSKNGQNWYRCGWLDMAMEDPIRVGIHALCPEAPATSTRFEYFKIYR